MKFLSRRESRRRVAIGRKEWIQVLGRSGILSTKRVETTTQVLLSLIVKEPRICATEILRNNRARAKLLRKRSRRVPPVKETFGQQFKKETCRSDRCATRYEKHGADRVREILERDTLRHGCSPLGTGSIICHWTSIDGCTDRFF